MIILTGCSTPKDVAYFQDTVETVIPISNPQQIRIEPNDKLSIIVKSVDSKLSNMFNLPIYTERVGRVSETVTGTDQSMLGSYTNLSEGMSFYTVSPEGYIDFPVLGNLYVKGMTRSELAGFIKGELMGKDLVKDPIVTVEFLNLGVSIMFGIRLVKIGNLLII